MKPDEHSRLHVLVDSVLFYVYYMIMPLTSSDIATWRKRLVVMRAKDLL